MALQGYELEKESPAPNTVLIKEFIWWYTLSTRGRLQPDGRPTVSTTLMCAMRFFRDFVTATGSAIAAKDRSETYRVRYSPFLPRLLMLKPAFS